MPERGPRRDRGVLGEQPVREGMRLETEHAANVGEGEDPFVRLVTDPFLRLERARALPLAELADRVEQHGEHESLLRAVGQSQLSTGEKLVREDDIGNGNIDGSATGTGIGLAAAV